MVRHVLLVEGHGTRDRSLPPALGQRGYAVHQTPPDQALAWARQHQPDLVWLSGEDGLCAALKLHRDTNLIAVVAPWVPACPPGLRVRPDSPYSPAALGDPIGWAAHRALAARAARLREGTLAEVRFCLPSDSESLEQLNALLPDWFAACGLNNHQARQLNLAVRELGANAIEWGHNNERHRTVRIGCRLDADKLTIRVCDSGAGFDRHNLPHAARPGDSLSHLPVRASRHLREGGFGILLASGLADHLCYNDAGNEAQLIKYLPSRARLDVPADPAAAPLPR